MKSQEAELKRMWGTRREIVLTENVLPYLKRKCKILDVGCGDGFLAYLLTKRKVNVVGVDISPRRIKYAHEKCPEADFIIADGRYLPFYNEEFESVTCCEVLEHVPNYPMILNEIFRVLMPKGTIVVTVPYKMQEHINFFDEQKICKAVKSKGFKIEKIYGIGFELEGIGRFLPSKLRILLHKFFYYFFKRANFIVVVGHKSAKERL